MLNIQRRNVFANRVAFNALVSTHDVLKPTHFLRAGFWPASSFVAWRRSGSREAAFALAVCGSVTINVLSFYVIGVASDFRYGYPFGRAGRHRRWRRRYSRWTQ
jgi:hypothetical protein